MIVPPNAAAENQHFHKLGSLFMLTARSAHKARGGFKPAVYIQIGCSSFLCSQLNMKKKRSKPFEIINQCSLSCLCEIQDVNNHRSSGGWE